MTEQALLSRQQSNTERDVLFPTKPDSVPLTTDDIIFPSENMTSAPEASESPEVKTYEDHVEAGVKIAKRLQDIDFDTKVERELIAQFFDKSSPTTGAINLNRVSTVLHSSMEAAYRENEHLAQEIEFVYIPQAELHDTTTYAPNGMGYSKKDVESLYIRADIHRALAESLGETLTAITNDDAWLEFAEDKVRQLKETARAKAIAILKEQEAEIERKHESIRDTLNALADESQHNEYPVEEASLPKSEQSHESLVRGLAEKAKALAHSMTNKIKIAQ